jgi:hypothetical protein
MGNDRNISSNEVHFHFVPTFAKALVDKLVNSIEAYQFIALPQTHSVRYGASYNTIPLPLEWSLDLLNGEEAR